MTDRLVIGFHFGDLNLFKLYATKKFKGGRIALGILYQLTKCADEMTW